MPTRGASGCFAACDLRTARVIRMRRAVAKRRYARLGDTCLTGSHVKNIRPSEGSLTPLTSRPAQGSPIALERRHRIRVATLSGWVGSGGAAIVVLGCGTAGVGPGSRWSRSSPSGPAITVVAMTAIATDRAASPPASRQPSKRMGGRHNLAQHIVHIPSIVPPSFTSLVGAIPWIHRGIRGGRPSVCDAECILVVSVRSPRPPRKISQLSLLLQECRCARSPADHFSHPTYARIGNLRLGLRSLSLESLASVHLPSFDIRACRT